MDTKQTVVNETSAKIAAINDKHRQNMEGALWRVLSYFIDDKEIFVKVRDFTEFNEDNDPYSEHDFGSFGRRDKDILEDRLLRWSIEGLVWSAKSDCHRVLTIMRADEY